MSNYYEQDYRLRATILGGQLCFSVGSREDFKVLYDADGRVEVAFLTSLDNILAICKRLTWEVKAMKKGEKKKAKKGVDDEGRPVLTSSSKGRRVKKATQHCSN